MPLLWVSVFLTILSILSLFHLFLLPDRLPLLLSPTLYFLPPCLELYRFFFFAYILFLFLTLQLHDTMSFISGFSPYHTLFYIYDTICINYILSREKNLCLTDKIFLKTFVSVTADNEMHGLFFRWLCFIHLVHHVF